MEDRLAEFRLVEKGKGSPAQTKNVNSQLLPEFSSRIKTLQQSINQIKNNNKEIATKKDEIIGATLSEHEKKISSQFNHYSEQNKSLCQKVKLELEELLKELNVEKQNHPNEPETRIKMVAYQAFSTKFTEIVREFQNVQVDYKNAVKNKITRQAKIIDPSLTDEQLYNIVNDSEGLQRLFSQSMGKTHVKVQGALSDMQDRYNDIRRLEQGVQIVHELFLQISLLVQSQGVLIDSIDQNVNQAQNYVKQANTRLVNAVSDHEKAMKWKWLIVLFILIVAGITAFVFLK